ncbi:MAG TPA: hypothetical protein VK469_07780 [Candidatus Kapabacteria bacterium]|nr:hypothetical protein [Candidatus Kapabacteria bacterium]
MDVKVGSVGKDPISYSRGKFHIEIAKLFFPQEKCHTCHSPMYSIPLDYKDIINQTEKINSIMDDAFLEDIKLNNHCELYYIDFTSNTFDLPREPLLIHLWYKLEEYFKISENLNFVILLKSLPSFASASHKIFKTLKKNIRRNSVIIIENSGTSIELTRNPNKTFFKKNKFKKLVNRLKKSPETRLKNKLIRRLGNFPQSNENKQETRFYSYLIDNCDDELLQLLKEWWKKENLGCDAIIYDSPTLESFANAIKSFCLELKLSFYRMSDLLKNNRKLLSRASAQRKNLLILDVVGTGNTLKYYTNFLKKKNISISNNILTAINKGGSIKTFVDNFNVRGFLKVDEDPVHPIQMQKELNLPLTSDMYETYDKLRTFDFWYMAHSVGWEQETDVPENIGLKYDIVPIFTKMLSEYGDWIAFKMEHFLKMLNHPQDIFVVHPDEAGAISVSDKLKLRYNRLTIIKIPREFIKLAQENKNNWEVILSTEVRNKDWYIELSSITNASALITDVFNASGSTFLSIYSLLKYFRIGVFCYFPFVDRDCLCIDSQKYPVPKYSLYDWFGPRKLKKK